MSRSAVVTSDARNVGFALSVLVGRPDVVLDLGNLSNGIDLNSGGNTVMHLNVTGGSCLIVFEVKTAGNLLHNVTVTDPGSCGSGNQVFVMRGSGNTLDNCTA